MIWTYRVFHDQDGYCVRVVNYDRDGRLIGYNQDPALPTGRTAEELAQDIEWFKEAFELPILTMQELDAELATRPPRHRQQKRKNKTIEELMAELDSTAGSDAESLQSELELVAAD